MSVPGSNLLAQALTRITPQFVTYYAFSSRATKPNGLYVTAYAAGVQVKGSVHAIGRNKYQENGLDFQKNYAKAHFLYPGTDIGRNVSGDQFEWNGRKYNLVGEQDWFILDGWNSFIAVDIGPATGSGGTP